MTSLDLALVGCSATLGSRLKMRVSAHGGAAPDASPRAASWRRDSRSGTDRPHDTYARGCRSSNRHDWLSACNGLLKRA